MPLLTEQTERLFAEVFVASTYCRRPQDSRFGAPLQYRALIAETALSRRWPRRAYPVSLSGVRWLVAPGCNFAPSNQQTQMQQVKKKRVPSGKRRKCHVRHRELIPKAGGKLVGAIRWLLVSRTLLLTVVKITICLSRLLKVRD
jgi:hypothetical protein